MFSARTPRGRMTVLGLILIGAFLTASPAFARHHHHDDGSASSTNSGNGQSHSDSKHSAASSPSSSGHTASSQPVAHQPSVPAVSVKAAPAPASVSPLDMTRDAAASPASGVRVADAGRLNPAAQIFRMTGALIVVLLLLVGAAHLFRRSPWAAQISGSPAAASDLSFQGTLKAAFSFLSPLASLAPLKRMGLQRAGLQRAGVLSAAPAAVSNAPIMPTASLDPGLLRLSGAQALPGSTSSVYLIQIGTKGILLGTSASGPIQVLSEFEGLEAAAADLVTETPDASVKESSVQESSASASGSFSLADYSDPASSFAPDFETLLREQDEEAAFDALMREETPSDPERGESLIVRSILERLNQTHDRLSRRLNDGTEPGEDRLSA